jgi:hypothetical protein
LYRHFQRLIVEAETPVSLAISGYVRVLFSTCHRTSAIVSGEYDRSIGKLLLRPPRRARQPTKKPPGAAARAADGHSC